MSRHPTRRARLGSTIADRSYDGDSAVRRLALASVLLLPGACARAGTEPDRAGPRPAPAAQQDPTRFETEIRAFEAHDRKSPPPLHGIVFVGSSSIKNWTAGDNDLTLGRTPARLLSDYQAFVARLRSAQPGARLLFVSIKPSPSRRAYMARAREANQLIRAEIVSDTLETYVDVFTPMLGPTGQPRPELFGPDSLHMTPAGYALWRTLLRPLVQLPAP